MKISLKKAGKEWTVEFSYGNQYFRLGFLSSKSDAAWMAKMLRKCFANYKRDLLKKK